MTNKVPKIFYTNDLIESQVIYDLIAYQKLIKKQIEWPIDLELFVKNLWGLEIIYEDDISTADPTDEIIGCLNVKNKKILINLKTNQEEGRLNFTTSHEAGHASLHSTLSNNSSSKELCDVIYCRKNNNKNDISYSRLEQQANHYASCLLLPKQILLNELSLTDSIDLDSEAEILKNKFKVSRYALELRLKKLGFRTTNNKYEF